MKTTTQSSFTHWNTTNTPLTLNQQIGYWADKTPDADALIFLEDGENESARLSYRDLHLKASLIASNLRDRNLVGERVLLLFHSNIEYVSSFLACLYAGVIAVPAYPPRNNYHAERIAAIAFDAQAKAVLTMTKLRPDLQAKLGALSKNANYMPELAIIAVDSTEVFAQTPWINRDVTPEQVAYLQYTSGSTGTPKGVMVRHQNLMHNCLHSAEALGLPPRQCFVSWLPIFHDMGLVDGICLALNLGGTSVFMPSPCFIQKPLRWLQAIDRYQAVFSVAPNFAYELCANKISEDEAAQLNLSTWKIALNGAEPILHSTLEKFRQHFSVSRFKPESLTCAYGLAEATLQVTSGMSCEMSQVLHIDAEAIKHDQVRILDADAPNAKAHMSSGWVMPNPHVSIVNPETNIECPNAVVGEIWVSGDSNCAGYWCRQDESLATFGARLTDQAEPTFLRTGDLGFIFEDQLYVTGRLKDLIIVRGANHYPQDIEHTSEHAHPALRKGGWSAAFSLDQASSTPATAIVIEVERTHRKKIDVRLVGTSVMLAVSEQHGIDIDLVVLIEPASIPKTSSGKIQRRTCKAQLLSGELKEIGRWQGSSLEAKSFSVKTKDTATPSAQLASNTETPTLANRAQLENYLRKRVATLSGLDEQKIDSKLALSSLGLNSVRIVELVAELSLQLQRPLAATIAFEYPSISRLAAHLCGLSDDASSTADSSQTAATPYPAVAIIGMACRLPQANSPEEFWDLIREARCTISEISPERQALCNFKVGENDGFRYASLLAEIEQFDPGAFGISPREAASIDPQQRLLLETAWHTLESAGLAITGLQNSATGVFVGISVNDYFRLQRRAGVGQDMYSGTGSALSIAANRISYAFGLQGPSMAIDTACSSSLVAVHLACRSLANGESKLALAGGVNLVLSPEYGEIFSQANMLSPSGRCHTFSEQADGYVRGEGCAMVMLKLLSDAERDGDTILGIIRGSAINQDGASNGLTAPNLVAQQQVIRQALQVAGLAPDAINYVETHGTGTPLGDPIEVAALAKVFQATPAATRPNQDTALEACYLGALKPNIAHLESAAGIMGLIKACLVLQHQEVPPLLSEGELNPKIDLTGSRLKIQKQGQKLALKHAGISSFGFGGTNAHMIIEAATPAPQHHDHGNHSSAENQVHYAHLLMLSAKSRASLQSLAEQYAVHLEKLPKQDLDALCYTTLATRSAYSHRLSIVAQTPEQMQHSLKNFATQVSGPEFHHAQVQTKPRIAFMFTGQGAQYPGMGRDLYTSEAVFRDSIDRCDLLLQGIIKPRLKAILFGEESALLNDTRYAQVALLAFELALSDLWKSLGITPEFVCGHSVGEYAAACVAGIFDVPTALLLVAERGRLMASAPGQGAMLSVQATAERVQNIVQSDSTLATYRLEIAAYNAPELCVISGEKIHIEAAALALDGLGVSHTQLQVSHAFHSHLMEPIIAEFERVLAQVKFGSANIRMIATGLGTGFDINDDANEARDDRKAMQHAGYWSKQLRQAVAFTQAVQNLAAAGATTFLEIGPQASLVKLGTRTLGSASWIASSQKEGHAQEHFLRALGHLFALGAEPHHATPALVPHRKIKLAHYPFDRSRHWFPNLPDAFHASTQFAAHTQVLAGTQIALGTEKIICFETTFPNQHHDYLGDHVVGDAAILPGAAYLSLMLSAAKQAGLASPHDSYSIRNARFIKPLSLSTSAMQVQTLLYKEEQMAAAEAGWSVEIMARPDSKSKWECYATASLSHRFENAKTPSASSSLGSARGSDTEALRNIEVTNFYRQWSEQGLHYGPQFQAIKNLQASSTQLHAHLELPSTLLRDTSLSTLLHPVLLDAAFQSLGGLISQEALQKNLVPIPVSVEEMWVYAPLEAHVQVFAKITHFGEAQGKSTQIRADLRIENAQGKICAQLQGLHLSLVTLNFERSDALQFAPRFMQNWQPLTLATPTPSQLNLAHSAQPDAPAIPSNLDEAAWILLSPQHEIHGFADALPLSLLSTGVIHLPVLGGPSGNTENLSHTLVQHAQEITASKGLIICPNMSSELTARPGSASELAVQLCSEMQSLLLGLSELNNLINNAVNKLRSPLKVILISRSAVSIDHPGLAGNWVDPAHAALAALWRSAALELPQLHLIQIDLLREPAVSDMSAVLNLLPAKLAQFDESIIALRASQFWVPRLQAIDNRPKANQLSSAALRGLKADPDARYLITGATSGLGLGLAHQLILAGVKALDLMGRRVQDNQPLQNLLALAQENGVAIHLHAIELADTQDLIAYCEQLEVFEKTRRPLRGVFHAAGVLDDKPLAQIDRASWEKVLHVKARSAQILDHYTRALRLDHFVLFSSIAAAFGSSGQCNYAAANGLLDAIAQQRRFDGHPGLSLQWGPWAEIGMASNAALSARLEKSGLHGLQPEAAFRALGLTLESQHSQTANVVIADIDWSRHLRTYIDGQHAHQLPSTLRDLKLLQKAMPSTEKPAQPFQKISVGELALLNASAAQTAIQMSLASLLKEVLRMSDGCVLDQANAHQLALSSLGIDSLLAMELRNRVRSWVNVDLPAHLLIGNNTLKEVADHIYEKVLLGLVSSASSTSTTSQANHAAPGAEHEEFVL